jgi:hypothetical protein
MVSIRGVTSLATGKCGNDVSRHRATATSSDHDRAQPHGNFLASPSAWWRVTLVLEDNTTTDVASSSLCANHSSTLTRVENATSLTLRWLGAATTGQPRDATVDVEAVWTLRDDLPYAELTTFSLTPVGTASVGVWRLTFSLASVGVRRTDTLFVPFLYGLAFEDPGRTLTQGPWPANNGWDGLYPSSLATMQWVMQSRGDADGILYMAAHDPAASVKNFFWQVRML